MQDLHSQTGILNSIWDLKKNVSLVGLVMMGSESDSKVTQRMKEREKDRKKQVEQSDYGPLIIVVVEGLCTTLVC